MQAVIKGLNAVELSELDRHESVIKRGLKTFADVGNALLAIRDARLYREQHETFEDYCREKWGFNSSRARQLIGAAEVVENLKSVTTVTPGPTNEAQARPLAKLPPAEQPKAWKAATDKAETEGRTVTAKDVEVEVKARIKPEPKRKIGPPCAGMMLAEIAVMKLAEIASDDSERQEAFNYVKGWIRDHEA